MHKKSINKLNTYKLLKPYYIMSTNCFFIMLPFWISFIASILDSRDERERERRRYNYD